MANLNGWELLGRRDQLAVQDLVDRVVRDKMVCDFVDGDAHRLLDESLVLETIRVDQRSVQLALCVGMRSRIAADGRDGDGLRRPRIWIIGDPAA